MTPGYVIFAQYTAGPRLRYAGNNKFSDHRRPVRFPDRELAWSLARALVKKFPLLRSFRVWVE